MDGEFDVEPVSSGEYRWTFTTTGGALYQGHRLYKTQAAARNAGKKWLEQQQRA